MRLATLRRPAHPPALPGVSGTARVDRRTRDLVKRLKPGDIAVIDHLDLDRRTAEALLSAGVTAVVNASPSSSGRYPNLGPEIVVGSGVPLLDGVGPEVLRRVEDGERLRLDGDTLYRGDTVLAHGDLLTPQTVHDTMESARHGLGVQLEAFTANAAEHLRRERDLLLDGAGIPATKVAIEGRAVLVVVGGHGWRDEIEALRAWIAEADPVVIGVEDAADGLFGLGLSPDVVIGDLETVSDAALTAGAELVLHVARDGRAPGRGRLQELGVAHTLFRATGSGEDLALLLADGAGARLIVLAGSHAALPEFIDQGRAGMPGTFLTRLRVGTTLVDARSVAAVYRHRVSTWPLVVLLLLALLGLAAAVAVTGRDGFAGTTLGDWWDSVSGWVQGLVGS